MRREVHPQVALGQLLQGALRPPVVLGAVCGVVAAISPSPLGWTVWTTVSPAWRSRKPPMVKALLRAFVHSGQSMHRPLGHPPLASRPSPPYRERFVAASQEGIPSVRLEGVIKRFGDFTAVRAPRPRNGARRVLHAARPQRLRQDHDPADGRRLRGAHARAASCSTAPTSPACPPFKRPTNTVFQSYALFPHLSVERQRGLRPASAQGVAKDEVKTRVWRRSSSASAWRPRPSAGPASCRAASSSGWRWRARWSTAPPCCCSTSRWARST